MATLTKDFLGAVFGRFWGMGIFFIGIQSHAPNFSPVFLFFMLSHLFLNNFPVAKCHNQLFKLSGLVKSVTEVVTGCLGMTRTTIFLVKA